VPDSTPIRTTIDLKTKFIPNDRRVYLVFPGDGYRYYQAMVEAACVFLDIPGLPLPDDHDFGNSTDLVERVTISDRIKHWHWEGRPEDDLPVREVEELGRYRRTKAKIQFAGLVRNFFENIRQDDIVVLPGPSLDDDVLFGEFDIAKGIHVIKVPLFPGEEIPGWKVRWVQRIKRRDIPAWLERKIPSPNPLRQIESSRFPETFDMMYERYCYKETFACKFHIKSRDFSTLDNFLIQQITLYVAALHENSAENNIQDLRSTPLSVIASSIEYSEDIPDLRISIHSPGFIVLYSKNLIPILTGVMMALASSTGDLAAADGSSLRVINSVDASVSSVECQADIQAEATADLIAMGYARWQELCAIEAQARQRTGIDPGMSVQRLDGSPQPIKPK